MWMPVSNSYISHSRAVSFVLHIPICAKLILSKSLNDVFTIFKLSFQSIFTFAKLLPTIQTPARTQVYVFNTISQLSQHSIFFCSDEHSLPPICLELFSRLVPFPITAFMFYPQKETKICTQCISFKEI
jgi:hypothetical protein